MNVPFSTEEFLGVLVEYNQAVWPMQIVLVALAVLIIALAWNGSGRRGNLVAGGLGLFWIWMGVVYHFAFFTEINKAAWGFGALFVVQGLLFLYEGAMAGRFSVGLEAGGTRWLAAALFLYALVIYPLLGHLLGHRYPQSPTFGLPCPTTIFTFAVLLVARSPVPKRLLVIPLLWSVIGFGAALKFGIYQDVGLLIAGLTATTVILVRDRHLRRDLRPRLAKLRHALARIDSQNHGTKPPNCN